MRSLYDLPLIKGRGGVLEAVGRAGARHRPSLAVPVTRVNGTATLGSHPLDRTPAMRPGVPAVVLFSQRALFFPFLTPPPLLLSTNWVEESEKAKRVGFPDSNPAASGNRRLGRRSWPVLRLPRLAKEVLAAAAAFQMSVYSIAQNFRLVKSYKSNRRGKTLRVSDARPPLAGQPLGLGNR